MSRCDRTRSQVLSRTRLLAGLAIGLLSLLAASLPAVAPASEDGKAEPGAPVPDFELKDKLAHAVEYFVLGLLLFGGIGWTVSRSKLITFLFLFAVGVSVGALDELLQSYTPNRAMDYYDWVADAVGVASGVALCVVAGFGTRQRRNGELPGDASGAGKEAV